MFLSPRFEIVRFKQTNVYLNRIEVKPRVSALDMVYIAKQQDEGEDVFMKDRSIFKDFKDDDITHLRACFEEDIWFGKIGKLFKKDPELLEKVKDCLFHHYVDITNIFHYYSGTSEYPVIGTNDFTSFARHTGIYDGEVLKLADLDLLFISANVSHHGYTKSEERNLQRYEFIEIIYRCAVFRFIDPHRVETDKVVAIERFLTEFVYPKAQRMDGMAFRKHFCYNVKTDNLLKKNDLVLKKLYQSFTHPQKKYVTCDEAKAYVRKIGLDISEVLVGAIYSESMQTIVDRIRDLTRVHQMQYVEFLVFLCRITHQHYEGTEHKKEPLYKKLDHKMDLLLSYDHGLMPAYRLGELFALEVVDCKKRYRRKKRQLLRLQQTPGSQIPVSLQLEIKDMGMALSKSGVQVESIELGDIFGPESDHSEEEKKEDEKSDDGDEEGEQPKEAANSSEQERKAEEQDKRERMMPSTLDLSEKNAGEVPVDVGPKLMSLVSKAADTDMDVTVPRDDFTPRSANEMKTEMDKQ